MAIEIRLTLKFSLLGANSFEETQILGFFSSSRSLMHRQEDAYYSRSQVRDEERDTFIKTKLPIKTAAAIEQLLNELYMFKGYKGNEELITPELTPNLWKVRENVQAKASYKTWIESELFEDLLKGTAALFDHEYSDL